MELIFSMKGCGGFKEVNTSGLTWLTKSDIEQATKRACIFNTTMGLFMLLFGLPGSVFHTLITFRNTNRRSFVTVLLVANSVSSMLFLLLSVPRMITWCYVNVHFPVVLCRLYRWIQATANCVNVWSLILLLLSRFLAVALPHTFFTRTIGKRGFIRMIFVLVVTCSAYCVRFFFVTWDSACSLKIERKKVVWVYVVLEFMLPVVIILLLSGSMLFLVKSGKSRVMSASMYQQSVLFMQLTILNSGWIFLSTLPSIIHFAISVSKMYEMNSDRNQWPTIRIFIAEMLVTDAFYLRHALDIFIYVACSCRFRAQLSELWHLDKLCAHRIERVRPLVNLHVNTKTLQSEDSTRSNRLALDVSRSTMFHTKVKKIYDADDSTNELSS